MNGVPPGAVEAREADKPRPTPPYELDLNPHTVGGDEDAGGRDLLEPRQHRRVHVREHEALCRER